MLLGQIVAISFATNLFFLALLLSPAPLTPPPSRAQSQRWLGPWLLNFVAIIATAYPAFLLADEHYWYHPTAFMPLLLAPHVALLLLPFARAILPTRYITDPSEAFVDQAYNSMWILVLINGGLMLLRTTAIAYADKGFQGVCSTLLEHPAVSSVGFDVIFCWTTWICWYWTQSRNPSSSLDEAPNRSRDGDPQHDRKISTTTSRDIGKGAHRR